MLPQVLISLLLNDTDFIPRFMTDGSAGADLLAAIVEPVSLSPLERRLIPCGFSMAIPIGYEAQIRPRSGLALKYGITLLNSPGTIDSDYRGEISVIVINLGDKDFLIEPKMRIAQMVIQPYIKPEFRMVSELPISARGSGGFGHTGF